MLLEARLAVQLQALNEFFSSKNQLESGGFGTKLYIKKTPEKLLAEETPEVVL